MSVGSQLKKARKARKIGQVKLSQLSGVGQSTICEIETGDIQDPGGVTLFKLSKALKIRMAFFFDANEIMDKQIEQISDLRIREQFLKVASLWEKTGAKTRESILAILEEAAPEDDEPELVTPKKAVRKPLPKSDRTIPEKWQKH